MHPRYVSMSCHMNMSISCSIIFLLRVHLHKKSSHNTVTNTPSLPLAFQNNWFFFFFIYSPIISRATRKMKRTRNHQWILSSKKKIAGATGLVCMEIRMCRRYCWNLWSRDSGNRQSTCKTASWNANELGLQLTCLYTLWFFTHSMIYLKILFTLHPVTSGSTTPDGKNFMKAAYSCVWPSKLCCCASSADAYLRIWCIIEVHTIK